MTTMEITPALGFSQNDVLILGYDERWNYLYDFPLGSTTILLNDTLLNITLRPFMQVYLEKEVSLKAKLRKHTEYVIQNNAQGIKLALDALVLRFAIRQFRMEDFDSTQDKDIIEVIKTCLANYYQSKSGPLEVSFKGRFYQEYVMDVADRLDAPAVFATLLGNTDDNIVFFMPVERDRPCPLGKSSDISKSLKKWLEGCRTFTNITMYFWDTWYLIEVWCSEFDNLASALGIEHVQKGKDETSIRRWFEIQRSDGKVLKVELRWYTKDNGTTGGVLNISLI